MKETREGGREVGEQGGKREGETRRDWIPVRHHPSPLLPCRIAMCHPRSPLPKAFSLLLHRRPYHLSRCFPLSLPRAFAPPRMPPPLLPPFFPQDACTTLRELSLTYDSEEFDVHHQHTHGRSRGFPAFSPASSPSSILLPCLLHLPSGQTPSHSPHGPQTSILTIWLSRLLPCLFSIGPDTLLFPPRAANLHSHHLPTRTPPSLPPPGLLSLSLLPCQPSCWVT